MARRTKRVVGNVGVVLLFLLSSGWAAAASDEAPAGAVAKLESELEELEGLSGMPDELRAGLDDIRMEIVYLKVKSRKHREAGGSGSGLTTDEIDEVSRRLAHLRAEAGLSPRPSEGLSLPVGTELTARLMDSLSTRYTEVGDAFTAITGAAVTRDGEVVIPAGSTLYGVVELVDRPDGRLDRNAKLVLAFDRVEIDGRAYPLTATVVDASEKMESGLGDEKAKMGVGAGVGAVLGAVLGGKKGALVGVIVGGSGAVLATEGKDVELDRGTLLTIRLDRELVVLPDDGTTLS